MKKRIIALVVSLVILLSTAPVFASEANNEIKLQEVQENQQLKNEIDAYLNEKLGTTLSTDAYNARGISELQEYTINRANGFVQMEDRVGVKFTDVEISSCVKGIVSQSDENIVLQVYEWTGIEYYASPDAETPDIMGYGTEHEMTFDIVGEKYVLVDDSFDERLITGVCSEDILLSSTKEIETDSLLDEAAFTDTVNATRAAYSVQAAIIYANRYCGVAIASQNFGNDSGVSLPGNHSSLYNSSYTFYKNADCANFVSQCLVAGGLSTDNTWKPYTNAWINARGLATYLISRGYSSYTATNSNVYPGNPVYWLNAAGATPSGHQMICTGYNSAGIPVVNAHNNDLFRVPITTFGSGLKTIRIVNSDQHTHDGYGSIQYNASSHFYKCKYCNNPCNVSAHVVVPTSTGGYCSVCGYTGPFPSYNSLSVCGEDGIGMEPRN